MAQREAGVEASLSLELREKRVKERDRQLAAKHSSGIGDSK